MNLSRRLAALTLGAAALPGCTLLWRPIPGGMDARYDDRACPATLAPVLLVFLPGAHMAPAELQEQGFVSALRARHRAVDMLLPDAHLGYMYDGSLLTRLHDDVIAPARAQGYRRIWLAGISLGGFLALAYAMEHPGQVEGIVTLAPYLGRGPLVQDIVAAGGPTAWRRAAQPRDGEDRDHRLWMWLSALPADAPPLWLGYGRDDRLGAGLRLLAGLLPAERVQTAPGGHDWAPWQMLWSQWLDRGLLPGTCTA